jgi:hypothetical protein
VASAPAPAPLPAAAPAPAPAQAAGPGNLPVIAPGYPPSAAGYPPPVWQAPETLPYHEGSPIPAGYRVVEKTRTGFVIAGALTLGIPYVIGLSAVSTHDSNNGANWLLVPAIGPWLAIAARRHVCKYEAGSISVNDPVECTTDALATTGLVFDGIVQTAGATLLVIGFALPKKVLVRQDVAQITFARIGSGYGVAAHGTF